MRLRTQLEGDMARGAGSKRGLPAEGGAGAKRSRSGASDAQPDADEAGPSGVQPAAAAAAQPPPEGAAEQLEAMAQADQAKGGGPAHSRARDGNAVARPAGPARRTAAHTAARR
jgi:hypothetical protein